MSSSIPIFGCGKVLEVYVCAACEAVLLRLDLRADAPRKLLQLNTGNQKARGVWRLGEKRKMSSRRVNLIRDFPRDYDSFGS